MGDTLSLNGKEAIAKIKEIAKDQVAMLCTFAGGDPAMQTRPMGTAGIDEDGTIWFMCRKDSHEAQEIAKNDRVQLIYSVQSKSEYLSVSGKATLGRDQKKIDEYWNVFAKTWFTEGKDDPQIATIRFRPSEGRYWDTKHNKIVQLAEIAVGALIGKTMDDGVQGTLRT